MGKVNSILTQRLKMAGEKLSKMANLGQLSSSGQLSSFSGVFRVGQMSTEEQEQLRSLLAAHQPEEGVVENDLHELIAITCEVKAINNQAAILHGERIKKVQQLLKNYREGAFSTWLIATYGNRQTPYNFLQYYELYRSLPQMLHPKLDAMPRQVVYALASRQGTLAQKEEFIKNYQGGPKQELLTLIRQTFPLSSQDKRAQDMAEMAISTLKRLTQLLQTAPLQPTAAQKIALKRLLKSLHDLIF